MGVSALGVSFAVGALICARRELAWYRESLARLRSEWTTITAVASVGVLRIHARVADHVPSGPVAVLVHGYGVGTTYLVPLAAQLGDRMRVYAPDLPGHGPSHHEVRPLSVPELAESLARWMDAQRLSSVLLIGHSLGCQVVVELAARRADLVTAVLLIGPVSDASARTVRQTLGRALVSAPFDRPGYVIGALLDYWRAGARLLVAEMRAMLSHRVEDVLPRVAAPGQVVRGRYDSLSPDHWASAVAEGLQSPPPITIPRWGHAVHYDAPATIVAIAASMLANSHPGSPPQ